DDVVDILDDTLGFRIAALIADPKIVRKRHVIAFAKTPEALRRNARSDNAVLNGDISGFAHADAIPSAPLNRNMIEDYVAGLLERDRVFLFLFGRQSLPEADVSNDDVVGFGE